MEKNNAIATLAALAHETRLDIYRKLVRAGRTGLAAGAVAEQLGVPAATLSFHFKELKNSGAIICRRDGRSLIYSASFEVMTGLIDYLTENCCEAEELSDCSPSSGTIAPACP
ncbi:MAG: ArsR family transcriptional regulator [Gammaproteobacteria bacterium]|jgi:ArsR family transcriptional regulator